jgi:hypothetical protein
MIASNTSESPGTIPTDSPAACQSTQAEAFIIRQHGWSNSRPSDDCCQPLASNPGIMHNNTNPTCATVTLYGIRSRTVKRWLCVPGVFKNDKLISTQ